MEKQRIQLKINGEPCEFLVTPNTLLMNLLRNEMELTGTKYGCGTGQCGGCTVLVNGEPILSCLTLALAVDGADILTIDNIDVFVVARGDLSQSMGYLGQTHHPEVTAVYDKAVAQIVASGRVAGVQVSDSDVDKYMDMGVRYLSTNWEKWIATGASRLLQKMAD